MHYELSSAASASGVGSESVCAYIASVGADCVSDERVDCGAGT